METSSNTPVHAYDGFTALFRFLQDAFQAPGLISIPPQILQRFKQGRDRDIDCPDIVSFAALFQGSRSSNAYRLETNSFVYTVQIMFHLKPSPTQESLLYLLMGSVRLLKQEKEAMRVLAELAGREIDRHVIARKRMTVSQKLIPWLLKHFAQYKMTFRLKNITLQFLFHLLQGDKEAKNLLGTAPRKDRMSLGRALGSSSDPAVRVFAADILRESCMAKIEGRTFISPDLLAIHHQPVPFRFMADRRWLAELVRSLHEIDMRSSEADDREIYHIASFNMSPPILPKSDFTLLAVTSDQITIIFPADPKKQLDFAQLPLDAINQVDDSSCLRSHCYATRMHSRWQIVLKGDGCFVSKGRQEKFTLFEFCFSDNQKLSDFQRIVHKWLNLRKDKNSPTPAKNSRSTLRDSETPWSVKRSCSALIDFSQDRQTTDEAQISSLEDTMADASFIDRSSEPAANVQSSDGPISEMRRCNGKKKASEEMIGNRRFSPEIANPTLHGPDSIRFRENNIEPDEPGERLAVSGQLRRSTRRKTTITDSIAPATPPPASNHNMAISRAGQGRATLKKHHFSPSSTPRPARKLPGHQQFVQDTVDLSAGKFCIHQVIPETPQKTSEAYRRPFAQIQLPNGQRLSPSRSCVKPNPSGGWKNQVIAKPAQADMSARQLRNKGRSQMTKKGAKQSLNSKTKIVPRADVDWEKDLREEDENDGHNNRLRPMPRRKRRVTRKRNNDMKDNTTPRAPEKIRNTNDAGESPDTAVLDPGIDGQNFLAGYQEATSSSLTQASPVITEVKGNSLKRVRSPARLPSSINEDAGKIRQLQHQSADVMQAAPVDPDAVSWCHPPRNAALSSDMRCVSTTPIRTGMNQKAGELCGAAHNGCPNTMTHKRTEMARTAGHRGLYTQTAEIEVVHDSFPLEEKDCAKALHMSRRSFGSALADIMAANGMQAGDVGMKMDQSSELANEASPLPKSAKIGTRSPWDAGKDIRASTEDGYASSALVPVNCKDAAVQNEEMINGSSAERRSASVFQPQDFRNPANATPATARVSDRREDALIVAKDAPILKLPPYQTSSSQGMLRRANLDKPDQSNQTHAALRVGNSIIEGSTTFTRNTTSGNKSLGTGRLEVDESCAMTKRPQGPASGRRSCPLPQSLNTNIMNKHNCKIEAACDRSVRSSKRRKTNHKPYAEQQRQSLNAVTVLTCRFIQHGMPDAVHDASKKTIPNSAEDVDASRQSHTTSLDAKRPSSCEMKVGSTSAMKETKQYPAIRLTTESWKYSSKYKSGLSDLDSLQCADTRRKVQFDTLKRGSDRDGSGYIDTNITMTATTPVQSQNHQMAARLSMVDENGSPRPQHCSDANASLTKTRDIPNKRFENDLVTALSSSPSDDSERDWIEDEQDVDRTSSSATTSHRYQGKIATSDANGARKRPSIGIGEFLVRNFPIASQKIQTHDFKDGPSKAQTSAKKPSSTGVSSSVTEYGRNPPKKTTEIAPENVVHEENEFSRIFDLDRLDTSVTDTQGSPLHVEPVRRLQQDEQMLVDDGKVIPDLSHESFETRLKKLSMPPRPAEHQHKAKVRHSTIAELYNARETSAMNDAETTLVSGDGFEEVTPVSRRKAAHHGHRTSMTSATTSLGPTALGQEENAPVGRLCGDRLLWNSKIAEVYQTVSDVVEQISQRLLGRFSRAEESIGVQLNYYRCGGTKVLNNYVEQFDQRVADEKKTPSTRISHYRMELENAVNSLEEAARTSIGGGGGGDEQDDPNKVLSLRKLQKSSAKRCEYLLESLEAFASG